MVSQTIEFRNVHLKKETKLFIIVWMHKALYNLIIAFIFDKDLNPFFENRKLWQSLIILTRGF